MFRLAAASLGLALMVAAGSASGQAVKDQSRVSVDSSTSGETGPVVTPPPRTTAETPAPPGDQTAEPAPTQGGEDLTQPPADSGPSTDPDDLNLGEIPAIKTIELTADA